MKGDLNHRQPKESGRSLANARSASLQRKSEDQWRHLSQPLGGGLPFPSSYSTATSLRLFSPGYVMCDMPKNVSIELAVLLLYHQKKHCKQLPLP